MTIYGSGSYVLSQKYEKWFAPAWHTWSLERRNGHLKKFRKFVLSLEQTFRKPFNEGQKPGYKPRKGKQVLPTLIIDRHENCISQAPCETSFSVATSTSSAPSTLSASNPSPPAASSSVRSTPTHSISRSVHNDDDDNHVNSQNTSIIGAISFPDPRRKQ